MSKQSVDKSKTCIYSDLDDDWRLGEKGITILYDEYAIEGSIRNIIATFFKERVMRPTFGSKLRELLMEPLDDLTASSIETHLRDAIATWDNRADIQEIRCTPDYENNYYEVAIKFIELKTGEFKEEIFTLEGSG